MSATAALSAATVATFAHGTSDYIALTTALALVTGVVALVAGLMRLGFLASLISEPVLKGFIIGLALTILVGQLPALFGVPKGEGDFFEKSWDLITELGEHRSPHPGDGPGQPGPAAGACGAGCRRSPGRWSSCCSRSR